MKNLYRIIFWGVILILCLACGILGVIRNVEAINKNKTELNAIINNFNNSQLIKEYKSKEVIITAELSGKNIVVNYNGMNRNKYNFKNHKEYLEVKYKATDNIGYIMVRLMADAISEYKGQKDESVYSLFDDKSVYKYTLKDGIEITKSKDNYIVKINLKNPIVVSTSVEEPTSEENNEISSNQQTTNNQETQTE